MFVHNAPLCDSVVSYLIKRWNQSLGIDSNRVIRLLQQLLNIAVEVNKSVWNIQSFTKTYQMMKWKCFGVLSFIENVWVSIMISSWTDWFFVSNTSKHSSISFQCFFLITDRLNRCWIHSLHPIKERINENLHSLLSFLISIETLCHFWSIHYSLHF